MSKPTPEPESYWDIDAEINAMHLIYNALLPLSKESRENVIKAALRDLNPKALSDENENQE